VGVRWDWHLVLTSSCCHHVRTLSCAVLWVCWQEYITGSSQPASRLLFALALFLAPSYTVKVKRTNRHGQCRSRKWLLLLGYRSPHRGRESLLDVHMPRGACQAQTVREVAPLRCTATPPPFTASPQQGRRFCCAGRRAAWRGERRAARDAPQPCVPAHHAGRGTRARDEDEDPLNVMIGMRRLHWRHHAREGRRHEKEERPPQ